MSSLRRQLVVGALTGNALRPVPGFRAAVPSMLAGWLTSELAPHLAVLTTLDAVHELATRRHRPALGLAAGNLLGLAWLVSQAVRAKGDVDRALVATLGPDYRQRLTAKHTDVDLSTPLRQLALPFTMRDGEVEILRDIAYADHGRRGLLDVYRRRGTTVGAGAPVLLQVHGGAWTLGSKDGQGVPLMLHMAARGWVCVAINYRLAPRDHFPAQVVDVKRAIAWVRAHGRTYGADPDFVAVTGGSAGGHLASLAALTPGDPAWQPGFEDADTRVQAAAPHYGVYDFAGATGTRRARQLRDRFLGPKVLGLDPRTHPEDFERASPLLRVSSDAPPFFVVHGRSDSLVGVDQARQFVRALREATGRPVGYAELPGAQHAFDVFPSIRSAHVVRGVDRFLRSTYDRWCEEHRPDKAR